METRWREWFPRPSRKPLALFLRSNFTARWSTISKLHQQNLTISNTILHFVSTHLSPRWPDLLCQYGWTFAAFGIYQASNRDAVQAILAARDMRELAATWRAPRPSIAIVSGEIAVEQINGRHNRSEERHTENGVSLSSESWNVSERSPYLIGQPVTEVQQLVSSAKSGQILVNQLAFERSRDRFHYDAWMGTLAEQHSEAYELMTYATETSTSGLERLNLDISVGRGDEQRRLEEAWHKAVDGHGQVIGISGEAGIGKTHLVNQLLKSIESATNGCRQIQVTCTYEVQNSSYGLWHTFPSTLGLPNFAPGEAIDDTLRIHFADKTRLKHPCFEDSLGFKSKSVQDKSKLSISINFISF
ncbi:AAA family ATPase [Chloroflexi bacterium TSY]|nr:AAA family ATPase [Chloroflexi bacterium TSY]